MRKEYQLKNGRANPYLAKLGSRGRKALVSWWMEVSEGVRVLPPDVAKAFPDSQSAAEALRLVMRLQAVGRKRA